MISNKSFNLLNDLAYSDNINIAISKRLPKFLKGDFIMNISDLMVNELVIFDESISSKEKMFNELAHRLSEVGRINKPDKFIKDLKKRESETSTGIEDGFGIPHAKSKYVIEPTIVFAHTGLMADYTGLDDVPIECVFMIAVPKKSKDIHLDILSSLSRRLMDEKFRNRLKKATTIEEVMSIITN